jgi:hypothetical protein
VDGFVFYRLSWIKKGYPGSIFRSGFFLAIMARQIVVYILFALTLTKGAHVLLKPVAQPHRLRRYEAQSYSLADRIDLYCSF